MVRSKAPAKKQQKHGVDFKKIKRKIGRKLPPPKNATNTEIKSKAIILPEQSVAAEKEGLAVSKKGLTLKELLQQTSHHNAKVRKDALVGIRDLALNYPAELKSHKLSIIEKLRERISDDDKVVRETLYQLLKLVIFPHSKEDIPGPFISLIMAYIFNAMTHPAIDVRLMAFKFFDLVVQHYPSSFSMYVEKVLQNYEDILQNNQIYLKDKGKLKSALAGLVRCLSLLPCSEGEVDLLYKKTNAGRDLLHSYEDDMPKKHSGLSSVIKKTKDLMPVLVNCFLELTPSIHVMPPMDAQTFDCMFTVLQSIDLAVKSLADEMPVYKRGSAISDLPICERPNMTVWEDNMMSKILKKFFDVFPLSPVHHFSEKDDDKYFILNIRIAEIFLTVREWIFTSTVMMEKFLQFIENVLSEKVFNRTRASNTLREKHLVSLFPFIPKLVSQVPCNWKSCLLQAFTKAFKDCRPESSLKLACLSAIKEMLLPRCSSLYLDASDPEILGHQVTWIQELPSLLIQLGDKHPSSSKVVLDLQLCLGQYALLNSDLVGEFDNMQYTLGEFYSTCLDGKDVCYGPFVKLPKDCQELSICCLYYFSSVDSLLIKSVAQCCLCENLEPYMLLRIIEVLQSAYKSGHIQIADHISFFVTLLACFQVFPNKSCGVNDEKILNHATFKSIIRVVSSCLPQMGDRAIVLQISQRIILDKISVNPPIDNMCALLRMLVMLDFIPTRLSEQSIINLSYSLLGYLLKASSYIPGQAYKSTDIDTNQNRICQYYFVPCFYLFERSNKLLNLVLDLMASLVIDNKPSCSHHWSEFAFGQPSRINAVVSVLTYMLKEEKIQRILSSSKAEINCILQNIFIIQSSKEINITMEERHKIHFAFDQLKAAMDRLPC